MAGWRDIKRKALGDIHRAFEIPAVYLTHADGAPVRVDVRLHLKQVVDDPQGGDWSDGASLLDMTSRVIFHKSQVANVLPKSYVVFGNDEAYLTGPSKPEREGYIWCEVSEVSQADLTALLGATDTDHPAWEGILS